MNSQDLIILLCYVIVAIITGIKTYEGQTAKDETDPEVTAVLFAVFSPIIFTVMVIKQVFFVTWWK